MDLGEQLRPKSWDEIIGQPEAVQLIRAIIGKHGHAGTCWWLHGPSGVGKTSMARLLAGEFSNEILTEEKVGRDLLIEDIRFMMNRIGQPTLCGNRVWVVNEAQGIPLTSIPLLLDTLEQIKVSKYDMMIFTAMGSLDRLDPNGLQFYALVSRCYEPEIADGRSPEFRQAVLDYLEKVSKTHRLSGPNIKKIAEKANWSIRGALSKLEMEGLLLNPISTPVPVPGPKEVPRKVDVPPKSKTKSRETKTKQPDETEKPKRKQFLSM